MSTTWHLHWLGTGSAQAEDLNSASGVLERDGQPVMMIDCGESALRAFQARYGQVPMALFITHAHLDHVGGMERLYYQLIFDAERSGRCRLYVPANLLPVLQARVADYPSPLAEGGANFWDAFQVIPVSRGFWHQALWFDVFAVSHHIPQTAFGLALSGSFLWTGDTRPIPAELQRYAKAPTVIAHDCAVEGNPSHTGIEDLLATYDAEYLARIWIYHYRRDAERQVYLSRGLQVAKQGQTLALPAPEPAWTSATRAWSPAP
ncbi:MBL fold metallo-hydrolase [Ahniella affigens]|uniref:MBL fold metallo-hydrolase n=1 Tax=Ahniella affigens TaxID=2021234 RepID=A0A2P1PTT5_9GAMM|nr:MBL fold metallo-hydrolase [Ahniella affigens]AVP98248.1 MBL fold metallo-hydrolase [Ahniella affigens]